MTRHRVLVPVTCVACAEATLPVIRQFLEPEKTELLLMQVSEMPKEATAVHEAQQAARDTERRAVNAASDLRPAAAPGTPAGSGLRDETPEEGLTGARTLETRRQEIAAGYRPTVDNLQGEGYEVSVSIRFGTDPARRILEAAEGERIDLIAMATHGRSGWARVFAGSVAESVMRGGKNPMLLARIE